MDKDYEKIKEIIKNLESELRELTRKIHDNPEVGNQEFKACLWQKTLLEKYGFLVETPYLELPTAYKAVFKGKKAGPKIAMLAEYDALKSIGHGCGHNLIAMVGVGAGIVIKPFVEKYGGEIHVVGTPAEETDGAKVKMADKGAFVEYDVVMMAHPAYEFLDSVNSSAIEGIKVEFFGKAAHAAENPQDGINALDAVINLFNLVNAMRQQTKDGTRIHGIITAGGVEPNTIPDYAAAEFYVRDHRMSGVHNLIKKVKLCAEGAAAGTGTTMKFTIEEGGFKDTVSNQTLNKLACSHMEELGAAIEYTNGVPAAGSSDLGNVSYECPAIQPYFKIGDPPKGESVKSFHTKDFEQKAISEEAISNGLLFIEGFTRTAIDLMKNPELVKAIKEEFKLAMEGCT